MKHFKVGDVVRPVKEVKDDYGNIYGIYDWCDPKHTYKVTVIKDDNYYLEGLSIKRSRFQLDAPFVERNYIRQDDECGKCSSICRRKEGKCGLYME